MNEENWLLNQSGGVALNPRQLDLFYLCPDDKPETWFRFWYADSEAEGGYRKDWANWARQAWYDVDATAVGVPIEARALCIQSMLDITFAGTVDAELWATVRAPSRKYDDPMTDFTGRPYGVRTIRTICPKTLGGIRDEQTIWVALEGGKFSVRADYTGHGAYPTIPAYMIRMSAAAYLL